MTRTNACGVLTILARAFALWLSVNGALAIATALTNGSASEWGLGPYLAVYGVLLALAGGLWLFADVLARLTLARPTTPLFESDLAFDAWQRLAFSCIGLWIAVGGLLDIAENVLRTTIAGRMYPDLEVQRSLLPEIAVGGLRFALGAALLFGARGVVALVARLRGREPAAADRPD